VTTDLHTVADVLARLRDAVSPVAEEEVPTIAAAGRQRRRAAIAAIDLPPFASSAMDGFALRRTDTPGNLSIVGRIAAGHPATDRLPPGAAMGIATGAAVPVGADAVVPIEVVEDHGDIVIIPAAAVPADSANVRPRGGDVRVGETVVGPGVEITPTRLAALLAAGVESVWCSRQPRVVVVTTGNELRRPGESIGPGQIVETNGPMIAATLARDGAAAELVGPVPDDRDAHQAALSRALDADLLVTSGGVSVGPHDLVRSVLGELGVTQLLWGVAVRPGKPLWLGTHGATLVVGLPGNPVSSLVGLELFVRPALRMMNGATEPGPRFLQGRLLEPLTRDSHRDVLYRAHVEFDDDGPSLRPLSGQDSHMIVRAAAAGALLYVERGPGSVPAGALVRFLALD
jgi:molybdopterin molybdotransferase